MFLDVIGRGPDLDLVCGLNSVRQESVDTAEDQTVEKVLCFEFDDLMAVEGIAYESPNRGIGIGGAAEYPDAESCLSLIISTRSSAVSIVKVGFPSAFNDHNDRFDTIGHREQGKGSLARAYACRLRHEIDLAAFDPFHKRGPIKFGIFDRIAGPLGNLLQQLDIEPLPMRKATLGLEVRVGGSHGPTTDQISVLVRLSGRLRAHQ